MAGAAAWYYNHQSMSPEPQMRCLLLMLALLVTSPQGVFAFEFAQGVIVDGAHAVAFIMTPEGGIDAIALSNGTVLTTTAHGAKPLLLFDDTLLAQAAEKEGALSLVRLRASDLEPTFTFDVPLPSDVLRG